MLWCPGSGFRHRTPRPTTFSDPAIGLDQKGLVTIRATITSATAVVSVPSWTVRPAAAS